MSSEELIITNYLAGTVNNDVKRKIKNQLISWLNYFNQNTPNKVLDEEDIGLLENQIAKDKIPCPFLIANECSIYPVRPIVCRTHIVDSDPEKCNANRRRDGNPIAKYLRDQKTAELIKSAPLNGIRLLAYAVTDYFGITTSIKPVQIKLLKSKR